MRLYWKRCPGIQIPGNVINNKGNLDVQIETLKVKIHAATQEILVETGNKNYMEYKWQLKESTIITILTCGSEEGEPTKIKTEQPEAIFNKTLKTILQLPQQTFTSIIPAETENIPFKQQSGRNN